MTNECYIKDLKKFHTRLKSRGGMNKEIECFQQDGATPHIANKTMIQLHEKFIKEVDQ